MPIRFTDTGINANGKISNPRRYNSNDLTYDEIIKNNDTLIFTYDKLINVIYPELICDTTNLIAHYKFDNPNPLKDEKNNYPLTTNSGTSVIFTSSEKVIGESSYFPASSNGNNYLSITNSFNPYTTWYGNGITFSWWMKLNSSQRSGRVFELGSNEGNRITINAESGKIELKIAYNGTVLYYKQLLPHNNGVNIWKHYVFTIDINGVWSGYLNGVNQNISLTADIPNMSYTSFKLGESIYGAYLDMLQGYLDDFRIYNKALTQSEITSLYSQYSQIKYELTLSDTTECDILIVAGGGSGGAYERSASYGNIDSVSDDAKGANAGGGGAGGLIYLQNQTLSSGTYTIGVGKGGDSVVLTANNSKTSSIGNIGSNSSISNGIVTIEAIGGGSGGTELYMGDDQEHGSGIDGGSGGGTGTSYNRPNGPSVGDGFIGNITLFDGNIINSYRQGYDGGIFVTEGFLKYYSATGGGGAGESGKAINNGSGTISNKGEGSDGGNGRQIDITGTNIYYAGGGGGTSKYGPTPSGAGTHGSGGLGGGGNAGTTTGDNGIDNTGGGGGGVNFNQYTTTNTTITSGSGGSGIVILKFHNNFREIISNSANFDIVFKNYGEIMMIYNNWITNTDETIYHLGNNIGIGTDNPKCLLDVRGGILATTKNFKIEHPLDSNMILYHTSLEAPRYDNIYRGKTIIKNGYGEVNIDKECNTTGGMLEGTFKKLNKNYQLYLRNNETYDGVRGYIEDNLLKIFCESNENIIIDWLVIGERDDKEILNNNKCVSGSLLCEHKNNI